MYIYYIYMYKIYISNAYSQISFCYSVGMWGLETVIK